MECKAAWVKEEDYDDYWDDPLHWNRTSVQVEEEDRREIKKKISNKEGLPEEEVVVMQIL